MYWIVNKYYTYRESLWVRFSAGESLEGKTFLCEKKNKIGKIQNPPGNAYTLKDVSLLFYPKRTALCVEFNLVVFPGVKN